MEEFQVDGPVTVSGPAIRSDRMKHPYSLAEETILITGGGTGLGFGMAKCFVQCGAKVVLVSRRSEVLKKAAAQLGEAAAWEAHDILQLNKASDLISRIRATSELASSHCSSGNAVVSAR